jgi:hypothetical protein
MLNPSNPSFFFNHVEPVGGGATRLLCPPHHLFLASGLVLVSDLVLCDRSLVVVFGSLRRRPAFGATLMFWIGCFMVEAEAFSFLGGFSGLGVSWWRLKIAGGFCWLRPKVVDGVVVVATSMARSVLAVRGAPAVLWWWRFCSGGGLVLLLFFR